MNEAPKEDKGNKTTYPFDFVVAVFVLVAALSQYSIGAVFDKTGEQVRGGVPVATMVLALGVLATVAYRKRLDWPIPSWAHTAFLVCISFGLFGLHRSELKGGIKEAVQIAEVFGLSWYLFATLPKRHYPRLFWSIGILGTILIPLSIGGLHLFKPFMVSEARLAALHLITIPFIVYAFRSRPALLAGVLAASAIVDGLYLKNGFAFVSIPVILIASLALLKPKSLWMTAAYAVLTIGLSILAWGGTSVWQSFDSDYDATHKKRLYVEAVATAKAPSHYPAGGGLGEYKRTINQLKLLGNSQISPKENKIAKDGNSQYLLTVVEAGLPATVALLILMLATGLSAFRHKTEEQIHVLCGLACVSLVLGTAFTTTLGRGVGIWVGAILGMTTAITTDQRSRLTEFASRFAYPAIAFVLGFVAIGAVNKGEKRTDHVSVMNRRLRNVLRLAPVREPRKDGSNGLTIIRANGDETAPSPNGIRVEGEAFLSATGHLKKVKANGASQGMALVIPLNSGKGEGVATYAVQVPNAGSYLLRARVWWEDGCSNSIRVTLGDSAVTLTSERFNVWHDVDSLKTIDLKEGPLKLILENVEDGIRLDYFELIPIDPL